MEQENLSLRYVRPVVSGAIRTWGRREGEAQAAKATRVRVPMRGTEADPLVVATKAL
jgi:hypothetical protein